MGGNKLNYNYDVGAPAASLLETKLLLNSVISDASIGTKLLTCDLKDFFFASPMENPGYMKISSVNTIPDYIKCQYNISDIISSQNQVYIKINKSMYTA